MKGGSKSQIPVLHYWSGTTKLELAIITTRLGLMVPTYPTSKEQLHFFYTH